MSGAGGVSIVSRRGFCIFLSWNFDNEMIESQLIVLDLGKDKNSLALLQCQTIFSSCLQRGGLHSHNEMAC